MNISIQVGDERRLYEAEVSSFLKHCQNSGIRTDRSKPAPQDVPKYEFADFATSITIQLDPESIRILFEYAASLLAIYAGGSLAKKFLESAVSELGRVAGKKLTEGIAGLWKGICDRVRKIGSKGEHTRVYFSLAGVIEQTPFETTALISPQDIDKLSDEEREWLREEAALHLLFYVTPIAVDFVNAAMEFNRQFPNIRAKLFFKMQPVGLSHWSIDVPGIGSFRITSDGRLLNGSKEYAREDVATIVEIAFGAQ